MTAAQRNDTVQWFSKLNKHFSFYPETFFLSTTMLDKVLNSVKVRFIKKISEKVYCKIRNVGGLYLAVLKISQISIYLIWRYYWEKMCEVQICFIWSDTRSTNFGEFF